MRVVLVTLLLAGLLASSAQASVTVVRPDGATQVVDLAGLPADVDNRSYRTPGGNVRVTGVSLSAVLDAANVDTFYEFDFAKVGSAEIDKADAGRGEGKPPVFYDDAAGTHFVRSGAATVTAATVTVELVKRGEFSVSASAEPTRAEVGELVEFTADVSGDASSPQYAWVFRDGGRADGATVRHRFKETGTYKVLVNVTTSTGQQPEIVTVKIVEKAKEEPEEDDTTDPGTTPSTTVPPSSGGGGTGGEGSSDGGSSSPSATPAPTPAPAKRTPDRERPAPKERGTPVAGLLLSEISTQAAIRTPAPRGGKRDEADDGGGLHVPVLVWEVVGLAALLYAGWWLEGRPRLRPRT